MTTPDTTDVLIVGAGPTGLMLAIELLRRGVACRIVDANDGPAPHSRAVAIQARTLELFAGIGIVDRTVAAGVPINAFSFHTRGKPRVRFVLWDIPSPYPFVLALPQNETERILLTALAALGGQVERQMRFTALTQDTERVTAALTHTDGAIETICARYLVGCDGAHSATRHLLHADFAGKPYTDLFWLTDVHIDGVRPASELSVFLGDDMFLLSIPLDASGRYRLIAQPNAADAARNPTLAIFQELMDRVGPGGARLRDPIWLAAFHLSHRKVAQYRHGRVFLAGDAAHIHSPAGGQGMNTGIQDAHNLAWKLALVLHDRATDALLDSYHTERNAVGARLLRGTDIATRLVLTRNPVARLVRDTTIRLMLPRAVVQRQISRTASETNIRYARGSAVARDPGGAGVRTGSRAPDAALVSAADEKQTCLFAILAAAPERYTLLLLSGTAATRAGNDALHALARTVSARYAAVVTSVLIGTGQDIGMPGADASADSCFRDPDGVMAARYGAVDATAYLVRPDGHIGWRGKTADSAALLAHLHEGFGEMAVPVKAPLPL